MTFQPQVVLKVGGSLSQTDALPELCRQIGLLAHRHDLLIIPGGGEFADLVRKYDRNYSLSETTAHHMAILAMDQYGFLLNELTPNSILVSEILGMDEPRTGVVPVLLPSRWLFETDPLPHSWTVTSDSIAAWVAGQLKAPRLVLLKDVDGLFSAGESVGEFENLAAQMSVDRLRTQPGGVDENLASLLARLDLETWVINGCYPQRLAELLDSQQTLGTCIRRAG
jgi:aspartokinase-like uncharacterized kinase